MTASAVDYSVTPELRADLRCEKREQEEAGKGAVDQLPCPRCGMHEGNLRCAGRLTGWTWRSVGRELHLAYQRWRRT